jgi:hypothetical protein
MFPAPSACAPARPRASALPPPPLLPLACPPAGEDKACFTPSMYVTFLNPSMCVTFLNPSMYVTFLNPSMCVEKLREVGSHLARAGPGLVEGGAARTLVVDRAEVPERHVSDPPLVCAQRTGGSCKRCKAKDACAPPEHEVDAKHSRCMQHDRPHPSRRARPGGVGRRRGAWRGAWRGPTDGFAIVAVGRRGQRV